MGVNSKIYLDPTARLSDVGIVIGALAGLEVEKVFFDGKFTNTGSYYAKVQGVVISPTSMPELVTILVQDSICGKSRYCHWHWESEPNAVITNAKLLSPKAVPFWIAVGKRLVDFFGGAMICSDCDDSINFVANRPRHTNYVESGKAWTDFQDEILNIKPISIEELLEANQLSAYTESEEDLKKGYDDWFSMLKQNKVNKALSKLTDKDKDILGL
jgi:hypothetical protein